MNILQGLNPVQKEAVKQTEGPLLIIAGAGSGKTKVITHRIAYLIKEKGVSPDKILAVTFTNKAAKEMKHRVDILLGKKASRNVWMGTFHSTGVRILRRDGKRIGLPSNFLIFDSADQVILVKECLKELFSEEERGFTPQAVLEEVSRAKERLINSFEYEKNADDYFERTVSKVYNLYQKKLEENKALDFDDLLFYPILLFRENPSVLEYYQEKFRYILVDEYQDTNHAQYVLVKLLAEKYKNLCVVGDEDQSIYGWRGADIHNILDFAQGYQNPSVVVMNLVENYRSTPNILEKANKLVRHNNLRLGKKLYTEREEGEEVRCFQAADEQEEALFLSREIHLRVLEEKKRYSDFVVLYRIHAQSRVIEETFIKEGIPYKIVGGLRFYERKEIKDILAYLRVVYNPSDNLSLKRIINSPLRGIGSATLANLELQAERLGVSLFEMVGVPSGTIKPAVGVPSGTIKPAVGVPSGTIKPAIRAKLQEFGRLMKGFISSGKELTITQLTELILKKTNYLKILEEERTVEARSRVENIKEFLSVTKDFEKGSADKSLSSFLEQTSLVSDLDSLDEEAEAVTLMTLHNAKGLEFPLVFMVGMEEGIFPHQRSLVEREGLEEERRLCYVGITRAEEMVYFTYSQQRNFQGSRVNNKVSRFIKELGLASSGEEDR
ncbi:MAG: ATP-dependent DNA helicase PcrA [Armatimonadetes bacterium CG07_land_8_20_14_0_80_40_9]|nr:MAG: ATP-dependent DNA helicase PcrA [Armatimonadetes bacterium CG07_land_8_20_14_0_80_40_9]